MWIGVLFVTVLAGLIARRWQLLDSHGLRILVWHDLSRDYTDRHTVSRPIFEQQLDWIAQHGYRVLPFSAVVRHADSGEPLPERALVLSFDDSHRSFLHIALPCLEQRGFSSLLLVPGASISADQTGSWNPQAHLSAAQLAALPASVELGSHSWAHQDFRELSAQALAADISLVGSLRTQVGRAVLPVLAYPYGKMPNSSNAFTQMCSELRAQGIRFGLRIGYGINRWPLRDPWRVRRIVIHGTDSFLRFRCKLRVGRVRF